ncbi:MAG: hypothetical protein JSS07_06480 [Proteobacteria bacterium]|nr:hypothetical protein [Pseudomonadota bacterium]
MYEKNLFTYYLDFCLQQCEKEMESSNDENLEKLINALKKEKEEKNKEALSIYLELQRIQYNHVVFSYRMGISFGLGLGGLANNPLQAFAYIEAAAHNDFAPACMQLFTFYSQKKNLEKGALYFNKALNQGFAPAILVAVLGSSIIDSDGEYLKKSSESYFPAKYHYAEFLRNTRNSTEYNIEEYQLLTESANKGYLPALVKRADLELKKNLASSYEVKSLNLQAIGEVIPPLSEMKEKSYIKLTRNLTASNSNNPIQALVTTSNSNATPPKKRSSIVIQKLAIGYSVNGVKKNSLSLYPFNREVQKEYLARGAVIQKSQDSAQEELNVSNLKSTYDALYMLQNKNPFSHCIIIGNWVQFFPKPDVLIAQIVGLYKCIERKIHNVTNFKNYFDRDESSFQFANIGIVYLKIGDLLKGYTEKQLLEVFPQVMRLTNKNPIVLPKAELEIGQAKALIYAGPKSFAQERRPAENQAQSCEQQPAPLNNQYLTRSKRKKLV